MWIRAAFLASVVIWANSTRAVEIAPPDAVAQQNLGQPLVPPAPLGQPGTNAPLAPMQPPVGGQPLPAPIPHAEPASPSSQPGPPAAVPPASPLAPPQHYRRIFKGVCSHGSLQFHFVDLTGTVAYSIHGVEYVAKLTYKSVPPSTVPGAMNYNHWEEAANTGHPAIDAWRIARRADHCGTYAVEYQVQGKWHAYPAKLHRFVAR